MAANKNIDALNELKSEDLSNSAASEIKNSEVQLNIYNKKYGPLIVF